MTHFLFLWVGAWYTTPVAALPLCGANHKSTSPTLCCVFLAAMPWLMGIASVVMRIFGSDAAVIGIIWR